MTRRSLLPAAGAAALSMQTSHAAGGGRIKQSVSKWCYGKMTTEELCIEAKRIGLKGIDLVNDTDWPTIQKYGLTPAMTPGAGTIPNAYNRKENHDKLDQEMRMNIDKASAAKVPNVITFSGNRKGMPDQEGLENCVIGLKRVAKYAEDKGVTINLELLNSKVNHKDYMADHTAWGVDVIKQVGSPRVKLLYDIYHMQIMEGDIIRTIQQNIQYIGHFHTGGVPGRHELDDTQELNWRAVATAIADLKYDGFFAHEFVPASKTPIKSLEEAFKLCDV